MKRLISCVMVLVLMLSVFGCGSRRDEIDAQGIKDTVSSLRPERDYSYRKALLQECDEWLDKYLEAVAIEQETVESNQEFKKRMADSFGMSTYTSTVGFQSAEYFEMWSEWKMLWGQEFLFVKAILKDMPKSDRIPFYAGIKQLSEREDIKNLPNLYKEPIESCFETVLEGDDVPYTHEEDYKVSGMGSKIENPESVEWKSEVSEFDAWADEFIAAVDELCKDPENEEKVLNVITKQNELNQWAAKIKSLKSKMAKALNADQLEFGSTLRTTLAKFDEPCENLKKALTVE